MTGGKSVSVRPPSIKLTMVGAASLCYDWRQSVNQSDPEPSVQAVPSSREDFTATQWTQVLLAAKQDGSDDSRRALERLCARYWPALYGFLRRQGRAPADAEDLTQGFFAQLLEANAFARADRAKGRFRNFLLGALHRFLADEHRRAAALKRGRDQVVLALDFAAVEQSYLEEAGPALSPEEVFDRRWAATVLETAFAQLQGEFRAAGQAERFDFLKRFLSEEASAEDCTAGATQLGLSSKAVSSAISRLRERYRELVRRVVLATVSGQEEIEAEFQELFR